MQHEWDKLCDLKQGQELCGEHQCTFCVVLDDSHSHMDLAWVSIRRGTDRVKPWTQKWQVGEQQTRIEIHTGEFLQNFTQVWISEVLPLLILVRVLGEEQSKGEYLSIIINKTIHTFYLVLNYVEEAGMKEKRSIYNTAQKM